MGLDLLMSTKCGCQVYWKHGEWGLLPLISLDVKSIRNIKNGIRPFDEYEMWMSSLLETWRMGFTPFD